MSRNSFMVHDSDLLGNAHVVQRFEVGGQQHEQLFPHCKRDDGWTCRLHTVAPYSLLMLKW